MIKNSWKIYKNIFTPFTKIIKEINFDVLPKELRKYFKSNHINQIAHPLIKKKDIDLLPEKLKMAVKKYFYDPESLSDQERDNIYQNLYRLKFEELDKKTERIEAKKRIANHFKSKHFINNGDISEMVESHWVPVVYLKNFGIFPKSANKGSRNKKVYFFNKYRVSP